MSQHPSSGRPLALVTGASEGFGRELARVLAKDGFDLVVVARNEARLAELAVEVEPETGARIEVRAADLACAAERESLAEEVRSLAGLKLLVNNAALSRVGEFHSLPAATIAQMIDLNLGSLCALSHAALNNADFRRGGTLLNVGSIGGSWPLPLDATYGATKAAIDRFSRAIAYEIQQNPELDVHVHLARLGGLRTGWADRAHGALKPGADPAGPHDWILNEPDAAARAVWRKAKLRRHVLSTDTLFARASSVLFGMLPRLGSRFVYDANLRERERRVARRG